MTKKDAGLDLAERFLDHLINPDDCIGTFGRSYIDDLEFILAENHGYDFATRSFRPVPDLPTLDESTAEWFARVCEGLKITGMDEFIAYVRARRHELDVADSRPRIRSEEIYQSDPKFRSLRADAGTIEHINNLQREWSRDAHKTQPALETDPDSYEFYLAYDRVSPWTYLLRRELRRGTIKPDDKAVTIGCRWSGEVRYFRKNIGLKNTMGVDLFSADPEFIVAADMHAMPFDDGSVKLVFARGVANKSYDIRKFVSELKRILSPDGFLVIEQPVYAHGVDVLGATDLKSSANLLRLFRGSLRRVIYTDDIDDLHRYTFNPDRLVKVFVQLGPDNPVSTALPAPEPFPHLRFFAYNFLRTRLIIRRQEKIHGKGSMPHHPKEPKRAQLRISGSAVP